MAKFEVVIFNAHVRSALDKQQPNETGLSDNWADNNYLLIEAHNYEEARIIARNRYSADMGFVIVEAGPL